MTENERFTFSGTDEEPLIKDNITGKEYPTEENSLMKLLNELNDEIKKLRTLNYVNKEAVRLNCIKIVKIGKNDVDCSDIDWKLLYELYGAMIDYYYDGDVE